MDEGRLNHERRQDPTSPPPSFPLGFADGVPGARSQTVFPLRESGLPTGGAPPPGGGGLIPPSPYSRLYAVSNCGLVFADDTYIYAGTRDLNSGGVNYRMYYWTETGNYLWTNGVMDYAKVLYHAYNLDTASHSSWTLVTQPAGVPAGYYLATAGASVPSMAFWNVATGLHIAPTPTVTDLPG
jgi:hypothetical protein